MRAKKTNSLPRTISGNIADIAATAGLPRTTSECCHLQQRVNTGSNDVTHHQGASPPPPAPSDRKLGSLEDGPTSGGGIAASGNSTRGSVVSLPTGAGSGMGAGVMGGSGGHAHYAPPPASSHEEGKASAATTVLRPRFGKEYKKLDRKKLVEELNSMGLGSPKTPNSPSVGVGTSASVFTFDVSSTSSHMSGLSGLSSVGDDSPRSPSLASSTYSGSRCREHDYVNLGVHPRDLADSPRFMDMTPPGSPRSFSSEQSNPMLNYAEIDFSGAKTSDKKPVRRTISKGSDIDYAMIDMVATVAAQKVGKEHAQSREDSLKKKDRERHRSTTDDTASNSSGGSGSRRGKEKKSTSSASLSRKGSSRSQSGSRDRKFSS